MVAMHYLRSTPVRRLWMRTLAALLVAVVMLGLAAYLFHQSRTVPEVAGALIFLICSLAALLTAITHSFTGNCPVCGARQKHLGGIHRCDHCLTYGEVEKGEYYELELDRVHNSPVFAARVNEQCFMPKLCSACGAPSTRVQRLRIIRRQFALNVDVPHCDLHTGGADLATEHVKREKVWDEVPVVKVASYRFYCEYLRQNKLEGI
jgi:hypothetical protein